MHAHELYNMDLDASLAVLSACETGYGKYLRGEGIASLSRGFRYAGCSNVVMSLWKAHDESTRNIMTDFYANLNEKQYISSAIRNAKLDFLQNVEDQQYAHPFYWSTFVPIGKDIIIQDNNNYLYYIIGGVLFLALLIIFRKKIL